MISIFDLFKIGIGPSSSHTTGPMIASRAFMQCIKKDKNIFPANSPKPTRLIIYLYGSLALTGKGHGTDKALIAGLLGFRPDKTLPEKLEKEIAIFKKKAALKINEEEIPFSIENDIIYLNEKVLPLHSNGLAYELWSNQDILLRKEYYSIGGGFVVDEKGDPFCVIRKEPKLTFYTAKHLLEISNKEKLTIAEIVFKNEKSWAKSETITNSLNTIWEAMSDSITNGITTSGILPGGLHVSRRAEGLYQKLSQEATSDPLAALDWIGMYAMAVNEENAAGRRVVTAPTNGAAGVIPAVIKYYLQFCEGSKEDIHTFLLTAGAIGSLFKRNAFISGAEVGCQGEVGVASSMAAAGLTAVKGGTTEQIEHAAEIAMEHFLGLTCDPVAGLVQIPCIERNAIGAVKAVHASRLALQGDGNHKVTLDTVIKTMLETGKDMMSKYKETSQGGLALHLPEC